jgi:hypothetical protein
MITFSRLGTYGRFGNQMFQYATLFAIGKRKKCEIGVPYLYKKNNYEYYKFCLPDCFHNLSAKDCMGVIPQYFVEEKNFTYEPGIFGIPDQTDILGYFQTEKYFVDYKNYLLKEFSFKQDIVNSALDARSLTKEPVISLHIRLGDYVHLQNKHPVCSKDYYQSALKMLPEDLLVYIFSDDPEQAENILKPLNRKYVVPNMKSSYEDMCLMTMCDYHIIANSSFSWWGSWLSNSKKTIAPSKWFGPDPDAPKNWSDIYCEGWYIV